MSLSFADVIVALVLLGTVAGFLAGMLGVGGALMMIPLLNRKSLKVLEPLT